MFHQWWWWLWRGAAVGGHSDYWWQQPNCFLGIHIFTLLCFVVITTAMWPLFVDNSAVPLPSCTKLHCIYVTKLESSSHLLAFIPAQLCFSMLFLYSQILKIHEKSPYCIYIDNGATSRLSWACGGLLKNKKNKTILIFPLLSYFTWNAAQIIYDFSNAAQMVQSGDKKNLKVSLMEFCFHQKAGQIYIYKLMVTFGNRTKTRRAGNDKL